MSTLRHFLNLGDAGADGVAAILGDALDRKQARAGWPKGLPDTPVPLPGRTLAMIFEKNSTRTRVSFEMAMQQLGGSCVVLDGASSQLGRGETIADTARVLSRYVDAIMIRTDDHDKAIDLARYATVPVINGLTDLSHPCQLLADMLTVIEHRARLVGTNWAWLGDGNNVCNSLIEAAALMGFEARIATPNGYEPEASFAAIGSGCGRVLFTEDPVEAISGAEVVVTDTWVSMGQGEAEERVRVFEPFQVDEAMLARALPDATFLHCLPAHRGEEVTDAVIDGDRSAVWDEAENRLHAQKSLLRWVFGQI